MEESSVATKQMLSFHVILQKASLFQPEVVQMGYEDLNDQSQTLQTGEAAGGFLLCKLPQESKQPDHQSRKQVRMEV